MHGQTALAGVGSVVPLFPLLVVSLCHDFLVGYSLAFFLLIFLSTAIVAGPLDAARQVAMVILAVCSLVTILGSLGPSAATVGVVGWC